MSWREWAESFLFAAILFLIVSTFFLGTYQIPSGSMEPTLMGGHPKNDRILVNRLAYLFEDPGRWDVVVFKYPMNRSRAFIKRVVGLPGEEIEICRGDLFIDGRLVHKPSRIQETLWYPVYPPPLHGADAAAWQEGKACSEPFWSGGRFEESDPRSLVLESGEKVVYIHPAGITSDYWKQGQSRVLDPHRLSDLRVAFRIESRSRSGSLWLRIEDVLEDPVDLERSGRVERWFEFRLRFGEGEGRLQWVEQEEEKRVTREKVVDLALPVGRSTWVVLAHADGQLWAEVGGKRVARLSTCERLVRAFRRTDSAEVSFGVEGASARVEELSLDRDLHYTNTGLLAEGYSVRVPEGRFFVLGDNSPNSQDSRKWQLRRFRRVDQQGRFVEAIDKEVGNEQNELLRIRDRTGEWREFVDVYGVPRRLRVEWLERAEGERIPPDPGILEDLARGRIESVHRRNLAWQTPHVATVPRDNLIGRAFLVYWPASHLGVLR